MITMTLIFLAGAMIGGTGGVLLMAALVAGQRADERAEQSNRQG
jgi:hypothetical protein